MEASELGERLLALCRSSENKFAEVHALLGSLAEDQRREVVRYKDEVIDWWAGDQKYCNSTMNVFKIIWCDVCIHFCEIQYKQNKDCNVAVLYLFS